MNRYDKPVAPILLILCLLLTLAAGCESFTLPTPAPQQTAPATEGTPSPEPEPLPTGTAQTVTEAPSPTPEPVDSPTQEPISSPTEEPTPEPTEAPTPTPVPTGPWNDGDRPDVVVTKYYTTTLPEGLTQSLLYKKYPAWLDYFVVLKSSSIRALPDGKAKGLLGVKTMQRYQMLAQVKGMDGKSVWYRVRIPAKNGGVGYIAASAGSPRAFQIAKAFARINLLKQTTDLPGTVRIHNYKNKAGKPPKLPGGKEVDAYGNRRDQAAPAYLAPDKGAGFRYAPDGTLARVLGTAGGYTQVYIPSFDEVRYIPSKYVYNASKDFIQSLTQVAVVDRKQQNIAVFEYKDGGWHVVSYCYISTGKSGGYSLPTPLGDFAAIEKKKPGKYNLGEFWYLKDGTDPNAEDLKFEGYAPYAVRFSAGAYMHGLPRGVSYALNPETGKEEVVMPRTLTSEVYGTFLGVRPDSHMCVRNYTSHAEFMWKWFKIGSGAVIVIE